MEQKKIELKIFCLGGPFSNTEWFSVLGDKFHQSLAFDFSLTDNIHEASVVAWDGIISPKFYRIQSDLVEKMRGKVLLLTGQTTTLWDNHPLVGLFDPKEIPVVELTGWSVLPEEILLALENCYQKMTHV